MSRRHARPTSLIRAWNPSGSSTVFWVENVSGPGRYLYMVHQGDRLFAPAIPGMQLGLGVYNGGDNRVALPTYVEGVNIAYGGPSDPNACRSTQMRQVEPHSHIVISHTFTPAIATGRPLTIVAHNQGYGFGEATFNRPDLHGLIHVYVRSGNHHDCQIAPPYDPYATKTGARHGRQSSLPAVELMKGSPQVGIGAGAETYLTSHLTPTSTTFAADATLVAALQLKSPAELERMLRSAGVIPPSSWYWQPDGPNWYTRLRTTTARQVPVAPVAPHIGPLHNSGGQDYGSL